MEARHFRESCELAMLLGLHVGDSLGATLEFREARTPDEFHIDIIGGGAFNWLPGQATDDTDLAIALLESLAEQGSFDLFDVASKYAKWFRQNPPDVGNTTRAALSRLAKGVAPSASGISAEYAQRNGSLMRCAPLALLRLDEEHLAGIAREQSGITHAHPNCREADAIFVRSLAMALSGVSRQTIFDVALRRAFCSSPDLFQALRTVPLIEWSRLSNDGSVHSTLSAAFWGLLRTNSFESAVTLVVNRGGDSDTCGAVTGALCGAFYGLPAIPERWLRPLKRATELKKLYLRLRGSQISIR